MATKIVTKNSSTAGAAPTATDLVQGELAVNVADGRLYTEDNAAAIVELGVNPATEITANAGIALPDAQKATFGAGDDLQIYHDPSGPSSIISDQGAGDLILRGSNQIRFQDATGGEHYAIFNENGAVQLNYDNAAKLATTSTGIDVTGSVVADGLTVDVTDKIDFGGGAGEYASSPVVGVVGLTSRGSVALFTDSNNNGSLTGSAFTVYDGAEYGGVTKKLFDITKGNDVSFYEDTGTTAKFFWDSSAESLGIGVSSPRAKLDLVASTSATPTDFNASSIHIEETGNNKYAGFTFVGGNNLGNTGTVGKLLVQNTNTAGGFEGAMMFSTRNSSNSMLERMRIDSSGNVGIGTSSPNAISGYTVLTLNHATNGGVIDFERNGTLVGQMYGSSNGLGLSAIGASEHLQLNTNGAERMRIDSSGNLLVGKSTSSFATAGTTILPSGNVTFTRSGAGVIDVNRLSSDGSLINLYKNGTTVGSLGTFVSSLTIGSGDTGLLLQPAYDRILPFNVSTNAGRDNAIDLGASDVRFDDIYATNGTIQTSDRNEKQDIAELSDAEQRVAVACKGLLRKFRWKDSVAEKGDEARTHFGIIAQDLQAAFAAEGLDAGGYAMFISTTWTNEETNEEKTRMGVRYSELLAFIIAAI